MNGTGMRTCHRPGNNSKPHFNSKSDSPLIGIYPIANARWHVVMSNSFKHNMYMPMPSIKNLMVNVAALVGLQPLIRDTFQLMTDGSWLNC